MRETQRFGAALTCAVGSHTRARGSACTRATTSDFLRNKKVFTLTASPNSVKLHGVGRPRGKTSTFRKCPP